MFLERCTYGVIGKNIRSSGGNTTQQLQAAEQSSSTRLLVRIVSNTYYAYEIEFKSEF